MNPMIAICPTMGRPKMMADMLKTFYETSTECDLVLVLELEDPCVDEYYSLQKEYPSIRFLTNQHKYVSGAFNTGFENYKDYKFYHMTNDDLLYRTVGWDTELEGIGLAFGDDMQFGSMCATFPVLSGEMPRETGWLMLPELKRLHGEIIWMDVAQGLRILRYAPHVVMEHLHHTNKKRTADVHDTGYGEMFVEDAEVWDAWKINNVVPLCSALNKYIKPKGAYSCRTPVV
jgi:hypothetical protein